MTNPQPIEIEKKYLIEYPDISLLETQPDYDRTQITQTYIKDIVDGAHGRIRKRGGNGKYTYTKTYKRDISEMSRIEIEDEITEQEYNDLLLRKQENSRTVEKERIVFTYGGKLFEVDIYPFWRDKAVMEVELESETEEFQIPPFINVIKDVTANRDFRNSAIAEYGPPEL